MRVASPVIANLLIGFVATVAFAQEEDSPQRVDTKTRAPSNEFVSERATTSVGEEAIARKQATSITDALESEVGIFTQSTNRGAGTLLLRGLVGPENLIYVDGVRFNQSTFRTGPNQYLNTFDPSALERIEVVRGPGSVLFGGGAMGGVVHLIPRDLMLSPLTEVRGSFATADDSVGVSASGAAKAGELPFWIGAGATILRQGDLEIGDRGGESIVVPNLNDMGELEPSSLDTVYWRARGAYVPTSKTRVRLDYFGASIVDAPRTDRIGDGEIRFYDNRDDLLYLTLEHDGSGWADSVHANFSLHRTVERIDRYNCGRVDVENGSRAPDPLGCARLEPTLVEQRRVNNDSVTTVGSSVQLVSELPADISLNYGIETYGDFVASTRGDGIGVGGELTPRDRGNFAPESRYSTVGAFVSGTWDALRFGEHAFVLRLGTRAESFSAFAPNVTEELGDVEFDEAGVVGNAGLSYLWGGKLHTYFTWNQGFRAPNLQETTVLGDTGNSFEVPNPELGPERSDTFELGSKLALDDWVRFDGSAYVTYLSDRITREEATLDGESTINDKPIERRVNRDTAYFYGAEAAVKSAPIIYDIHVFGNVTWIDGAIETDEEDDTFQEGPLHGLVGSSDRFYSNPRRLSPVRWNAGASWEPSPAWYLTLWAAGAGAQDKLAGGDRGDLRICQESPGILYSDVGAECPGTDAWATLNARAGYRHENFTADLAVRNVLDQRYRLHGSGYPAAGFNVLGTIGIRAF